MHMYFCDVDEVERVCSLPRHEYEDVISKSHDMFVDRMSDYLYNPNSTSEFKQGIQKTLIDYKSEHKKELKAISDIVVDDCHSLKKCKFKLNTRMTYGSMVNVSRYLNGCPDCFVGVKKRNEPFRSIRIFVAFGGTFYKNKAEFLNQGIASSIISEALESSGIGCEINLINVYRNAFTGTSKQRTNAKRLYGDNKYRKIVIRIKKQNEYLDIGHIGYLTGNSHFYRDLCFTHQNYILAQEETRVKKLGCTVKFATWRICGSVPQITNDMIEDKDNFILIPRLNTEQEAIEFATKKVKEYIF